VAGGAPGAARGKIYLEGEFSHRQTLILLLSVVFLTLGLYLLVALVLSPGPRGWDGILFVLTWMAIMVPVSAVSVYRFITDRRDVIRLDDEGVTIGDDHWGWDEIAWIRAASPGLLQKGMQLEFQPKGFSALRGILPDEPLSPRLCADVLAEMKAALEERHPGLVIIG